METLTTVQQNPVSAAAGVPLHRQLFLVLHDEIDRGVMAPGDALPTEQTLCDQFGVSRITVRRALADLAELGYIERRQGVGSFVRRHGPADVGDYLGSGRTFMQGLRQTQFETEVDVVELGVRRPPAVIADALEAPGELLQVLRVRRQRRTGEPLIVSDAWLPTVLADAVTEPALRRAPLYQLLSEAGVVVHGYGTRSPPRSCARATPGCSTPRSAPRCCASIAWPSWPVRRTTTCRRCYHPPAAACCSARRQTNWTWWMA